MSEDGSVNWEQQNIPNSYREILNEVSILILELAYQVMPITEEMDKEQFCLTDDVLQITIEKVGTECQK